MCKPDEEKGRPITGTQSCGPVSVEGFRDYLDAVTPILESDGSLKANLYAVALAHELDRWRKRAKYPDAREQG